MSDKTFWVNKLAKRQCNKYKFLRFDVGGEKSWSTTVLTVSAIAFIFGLFTYMRNMSMPMLILAIAAIVIAVVTFVYNRIEAYKGMSNFIYRTESGDMLFQYVSNKHIVFSMGDITLEFKNKKVTKIDGPVKPEALFENAAEVLYTGHYKKGENVFYVGKNNFNGKDHDYKIKLTKDNKFQGYYVDNTEVKVYVLDGQAEQKLGIPAPLHEAIRNEGITLPGEDVITIVYKY